MLNDSGQARNGGAEERNVRQDHQPLVRFGPASKIERGAEEHRELHYRPDIAEKDERQIAQRAAERFVEGMLHHE